MFSLRTLFVVVTVAAAILGTYLANSSVADAFFCTATLILALWSIVQVGMPFWRAFAIVVVGFVVALVLLGKAGQPLPTDEIVSIIDEPLYMSEENLSVAQYLRRNERRVASGFYNCAIAVVVAFCAGTANQWRTQRAKGKMGRTTECK